LRLAGDLQINPVLLFSLEREHGRQINPEALLEAKEAGSIRSVGVSNFGVKHLEEIRNAGFEMPSVNQIELHPFCQQQPIVSYCREHSIIVQAYCPILRGKWNHENIQKIAAKVRITTARHWSKVWGKLILIAQYDRDPAQILLRWSLQNGFVPLPKSATPSRIHSNTNLYDFELNQTEMDELDGLDQGTNGAISWNPIDLE
jgi:diketogulonate reductase-like aldo/keto reductase